MSMTHLTRLTIAAGIVAGASGVSGAALSDYIPVTVTNETSQFQISMADYFGPGSDPISSGTFPTEITWQILILNSEGFDIGQVALRMNPFPGEDYGTDDIDFDSIVFVDPDATMPAGFVGPAVLDVLDSPSGFIDIDSPFTVDDFVLSDDTSFMAANQRLDVAFSDLEPHALGDELLYQFTIYNPNRNLYNFSFEFFPVPTPGTAALAGLGLLGLSSRRRS